jgi:ubiquinone/menaquinone biosynthesis C-methylase UbiE
LIALDLTIQAHSTDALWSISRGVTADTLLFFGRLRRKDWVTAQFATQEQAQTYVDEHAPTSLDGQHRTARIRLLHELLTQFPAGEVLDAGCGPGMLARSLLDSPAFNYRITMLDQSEAMIRYCATYDESDRAQAMVGDLEHLPFDDASFDVAVSTGALEYTNARRSVRELSRVTKLGGAVVVSMLNPLSPYWLTDWFLRQPVARLLSWMAGILRLPIKRQVGGNHTGIRALRSRVLGRYLRRSGLVPVDVIYFGLTPLVRPLDRIRALRGWSDRHSCERLTTRGRHRWMATGYVIVAFRR